MQSRRSFAIASALEKKAREARQFKIIDHLVASNYLFEKAPYSVFKLQNQIGETRFEAVREGNGTAMWTNYNIKFIEACINELKAR
jgi:hypothetical protein